MVSFSQMQGVSAHVHSYYESPIGLLLVRGSERGISSVLCVEGEREDAGVYEILQPCMDQLHAYFSGSQHNFHSLPLAIQSTDFQLQVWEYLITIPYGETRTYSQVAAGIGHPKAVRAVGSAVGRNPLSLLIPCHRVVPVSGEVGEYAHGAWRKEWLLRHEHSVLGA